MSLDPDQFSSPKRILQARHLRPRKRFGQHFLTDPRVAERIAAALPAGAHVVEIGAGTGTLTAALLARARAVTALEIDRDLSLVLAQRFAGAPNFRIITVDILDFDFKPELDGKAAPRALCGNLPYYITTPIIERIFGALGMWEDAVLMLQHEYAGRLLAAPGSKQYGSLSVYAAYFSTVEKLFDIGAGGFYPPPEVSSSVVRLQPKTSRLTKVRDERLLLWLIRAAFRHRRKTFVNSVMEALRGTTPSLRQVLEAALRTRSYPANIRGERLALADFCVIADTITDWGLLKQPCTTPHNG